MDTDAERIIEHLLPVIETAGNYACFIQQNIRLQPEKYDGHNPFAAALTDADLSVQNFIEVSLLASYPDVAFFGEEEDSSINMKYFPGSAPLKVYLDPIDGTRYYQDQDKHFNIIATICSNEHIEAAVVYMPAFRTFYLANRGKGSYVRTVSDLHDGKKGSRLTLNTSGNTLVTYAADEVSEKFSSSFTVVNVGRDYTSESPCLSINSILMGDSVGIAGRGANLIDWGAIAFIASEAGGVVTDFAGREALHDAVQHPNIYPEIFIASDREILQSVLATLE